LILCNPLNLVSHKFWAEVIIVRKKILIQELKINYISTEKGIEELKNSQISKGLSELKIIHSIIEEGMKELEILPSPRIIRFCEPICFRWPIMKMWPVISAKIGSTPRRDFSSWRFMIEFK